MVNIGNDWDELLKEEFRSSSYEKLRQFLIREYQSTMVYPAKQDIFNALKATPYHSVRVVILGQDPYHGAGQAHGMCFSVQKGVPIPPSLRNIYKELTLEYGYPIPSHGNLSAWALDGVLLLNTILTVEAGKPMSHQGRGWEEITDEIIRKLGERETPMVFLLWGAAAQKKVGLIDSKGHLVLKTTHPSPLAAHRGFFGCGHFQAANEFLKSQGMAEVRWQIQ